MNPKPGPQVHHSWFILEMYGEYPDTTYTIVKSDTSCTILIHMYPWYMQCSHAEFTLWQDTVLIVPHILLSLTTFQTPVLTRVGLPVPALFQLLFETQEWIINFSLPNEITPLPTKMHSLTFSIFAQTPIIFAQTPIIVAQPSTFARPPAALWISGSWNALVQMEGDRRFVYNCCHSLTTENATDGR